MRNNQELVLTDEMKDQIRSWYSSGMVDSDPAMIYEIMNKLIFFVIDIEDIEMKDEEYRMELLQNLTFVKSQIKPFVFKENPFSYEPYMPQ